MVPVVSVPIKIWTALAFSIEAAVRLRTQVFASTLVSQEHAPCTIVDHALDLVPAANSSRKGFCLRQ